MQVGAPPIKVIVAWKEVPMPLETIQRAAQKLLREQVVKPADHDAERQILRH